MSRGRCVVLLVGLVALALFGGPAAAQPPIFATLSGPAAVGPSRTATYELNVSGGPGESVNYSVNWFVSGPEPEGASPRAATPATTSGIQSTFRLNITVPAREQTLTLTVHVNGTSGGTTESTTVERSIVVVTPIVLSGTFRNDGSTAAVNVTVRFYVDDAFVGTQTIARINPRGQATATFDYLPPELSTGTHRIRIEADLDGDGRIDAARGETILSDLFYKGTPPLGTGVAVLIGIGVFVPVFFLTVALRRRNKP